MPDKTQQTPVFDMRQFIPQPYADDSLFGLLGRCGHLIIREDDFPPPAGPGQQPHDPVMLSKVVLLMTKNSWTEREAARRYRRWSRSALGDSTAARQKTAI